MTAARPVIRTVTGDVAADDLGPTLIHEHIISTVLCYWEPEIAPAIAAKNIDLVSLSEVRRHPFAVRSNLILDDVATAVDELSRLSTAGGWGVIDATSHGLGRDARAVRLVSEQSGVRVVLGCGYYIRSSHPPGVHERSVSQLAEEMERDIVEGIDGSGVRAGIIGEIGAGSYPMDPVERRVMQAAARAQVATGAGMVVHPAPGDASAFEVADVLEAAGASMDKVLMSHVDERLRGSRTSLRRLADYGCLLGFDTFGREIYYAGRARQHPSDADRIQAIVELLEMGLGDRIGLSQDICLRHELSSFGGHGYAHVLTSIVPRLVDAGVPASGIEQMLVLTPRRFTSLTPPVSS